MSWQTVVTPNDGVIVICLMGTAWVEVVLPGHPIMTYGRDDERQLVMVLAGARITAFGCTTRAPDLGGDPVEHGADAQTGTVGIYSAGNLHLLGSNGDRWPA